MGKVTKSVKKFVALAGAASAFVAIPVLAQNMSAPQMQSQAQAQPMNSSASMNSTQSMSIASIASSSQSFNVLDGLLRLTNLDEALKGGSYTVFAPTDAAFAALPPETFRALLKPENRKTLVEILKYHVVSGDMTSTTLKSGAVKTIGGSPVEVSVAGTGVTVSGATVTQPDIQARNGVIHAINRVIVPSDIAAAITSKLGANALTLRSFSELTSSRSSSMTMSSRASSGNMTMSQEASTQNRATESTGMSSNSTMSASATSATGSIVDIASSNASFKTLTAALKAAGLDKALASGGPYTVFAPTDEAFAALPEGTIEELLKPENRDVLVQILTYHVVPGEQTSTMLKSGTTETLGGVPVEVKVSSNGVMVNDANVVQADIKANNGVIHVIDRVMLPSREQMSSSGSDQ
ncbi:MAG: fasciclin domain-containing protein [Cyanobacteriota bacterium]